MVKLVNYVGNYSYWIIWVWCRLWREIIFWEGECFIYFEYLNVVSQHHLISGFMILWILITVFCSSTTGLNEFHFIRSSALIDRRLDDFLLEISPNAGPLPFLPILAPYLLQPFTNNSILKLSGSSFTP